MLATTSTMSMNKRFLLFVFLCCKVSFANAEKWDGLRVHWGHKPGPKVFQNEPRTEAAAIKAGYKKIADCSDYKPSSGSSGSPFTGRRYVKNGDYTVVLIYDVNGYIAGVQTGVKPTANYPPPTLLNAEFNAFVFENGRWFLTAYFVFPGIICNGGRTKKQFEKDGTGTDVYLQTGDDPIWKMTVLPKTQKDTIKTRWELGKCIPTMGVHYWYKVSKNMPCNTFFPMFLLYNKEKLNAFGWGIFYDVKSPIAEHPPFKVLKYFFRPKTFPICLPKQTALTTLHFYLTNNPMKDLC